MADYSYPPLIILAGGQSSRFGSPKGLAVINGRSLLAMHVSSYPWTEGIILVVTGYHAKAYASEVFRITEANPSKPFPELKCVVNSDPDRGQFSSIQTGLAALDGRTSTGVIVQPVDAGPVHANLLMEMAKASRKGTMTVVPTMNGKSGHPVLLSRDLAGSCLGLDPAESEARLDFLLRNEPPEKLVRIAASTQAVLQNFNFPSDLPQTPS